MLLFALTLLAGLGSAPASDPALPEFGACFAILPDVSGDGIPEIAVSSPGVPRSGPPRPGRVWILDGADRSIRHELEGYLPHDRFGERLALGADVDRDGFRDLLISVPGHRGGSVVSHSSATGERCVRTWWPPGEQRFGASLALVDDHDLDGMRDFTVASLSIQPTLERRWTLWLVSARTGQIKRRLARYFGAGSPPEVAAIDDLNGDRRPDFVAVGRGWATLLSSRNGYIAGGSGVTSSADAGFGAAMKNALIRVGDVNHDGWADWATSAPGVQDPRLPYGERSDCGLVTLVSGLDGRRLHEWYGQPGEGLGADLAAFGDLDGDGTPDLVASTVEPFDHGLVYLSGEGRLLKRVRWKHDDPYGHTIERYPDQDGDGHDDVLTNVYGFSSWGDGLRLVSGATGKFIWNLDRASFARQLAAR